MSTASGSGSGRRVRRMGAWGWIGVASLILLAVVFIIGEVMVRRAQPILKDRIEKTLRTRFHGRAELGSLDVSVWRGIEVSGNGLRIYPPDRVATAGAKEPLIEIGHFAFHAGLLGLVLKPVHAGTVQVTGLRIHIPPREMRQQAPQQADTREGKIEIVVERIVCERSRLVIETSNPAKDPKDFELEHIELQDVGPSAPWKYEAVLTNAIPRGDIRANGTFGPWQAESPGDSKVTGKYTFDHADLSTIKGIGGTLSSVGSFAGQLNQIVVDGTTETPNFSLDTANHPMPLHTKFHAIVDGTTGDTYLQPVNARLRDSIFQASGAVINIKGQGHRIDLDVDVPNAQLQDFLDLAVKTHPAVMTGRIGTKANLHIAPGKQSVPQKLSLAGGFTLQGIRFTNPQVQEKVDVLSLRARGEPKEARAGAPDVNSEMRGTFQMAKGVMRFPELRYSLPGAQVNLEGIYSLDGQQFEFHGHVLTDAPLSRMVSSPVFSLLLKAVSPFFKRKGGGADIPVRISGTKSAPKFGLDVFRHDDASH